MMPSNTRAQTLIDTLQLQPHPEGGWFREVFRATAQVQPADGRTPRHALTSIYFLLEARQRSHWHRVTSDEVWVHLEGSPLSLWAWNAMNNEAVCTVLGPVDMAMGRHPQHTIPAGLWQAAEPLADDAPGASAGSPDNPQGYTLVACMVGPGFDFVDFELMQSHSAEAIQLRQTWPELNGFIPASISST